MPVLAPLATTIWGLIVYGEGGGLRSPDPLNLSEPTPILMKFGTGN